MATFDVVIPLGPKDEDIIQRCVESVHKNLTGFRRIYVIATKKIDLSGCFVINEDSFPFTREAVAQKTSEDKAGWYLQQLIKFYAPLLISGALENVLVLDADTVFYKRTRFIEGGKYLFDKVVGATSEAYYEHMARLHPSFVPWKKNTSGITNMMIFSRPILIELMGKVETAHGKDFWEAYLDCIRGGASEYEIYFNYMMNVKSDISKIRPLQWNNYGQRADTKISGDWNYVNYHHQHQKKPRTFI